MALFTHAAHGRMRPFEDARARRAKEAMDKGVPGHISHWDIGCSRAMDFSLFNSIHSFYSIHSFCGGGSETNKKRGGRAPP